MVCRAETEGKKRKEKKATIELHFKNPEIMGKEKYKEGGCKRQKKNKDTK